MEVKMLQATPNMSQSIAQAASVCYDSDPTRTDRLKGIVASKHLSCLRFASATIQINAISRVCSHQLIRHAHLDYLQRSQRYVSENTKLFVTPPHFVRSPLSLGVYERAMTNAWEAYTALLLLCEKPEDARYVLPGSCMTNIVITGNMQAWRDFLYGPAGRKQKAAQWEIRTVAEKIEDLLEPLLPIVFGENRHGETCDKN